MATKTIDPIDSFYKMSRDVAALEIAATKMIRDLQVEHADSSRSLTLALTQLNRAMRAVGDDLLGDEDEAA